MQPDPKVRREFQETSDHKVLLDLRDPPARMVKTETSVHRVLLALRDPPARPEPQVLPVRLDWMGT